MLIDNDNLFGLHRVIPTVQQQIAAIKALRADRRGTDRRQLLQLQTQYSEPCGWPYQDLGTSVPPNSGCERPWRPPTWRATMN
ncbi:hypothetical protein [Streptomyces sp. NRRL S-241]|uniref:hypothetical protein n=1 Tax=Streptomyces sp. NRRL S-241 TaxID=1463896 RepID=UPI000B1FE2B6|nr:hypothetical protein [Streptomyces sp. NRRL S-241]